MSGTGGRGWRGIAVPLVVATLAAGACARSNDAPPRDRGDTPAELRVRAELEPRVAEYFHLRKRAMLDGSADVLWRRFPELRRQGPPGAGINAEGLHVAGWRGIRLIDGDIHPEAGERFGIRVDGDTAAVKVRALESYLRADFGRSAWELSMTLVFSRRGGRWELVRTDEATDAENHRGRH